MALTPLFDDMDGSPGARTVSFALEGQPYEINLGPDNLAALKAMLRPYLLKAHPSENTDVLVCLPARLHHSAGTLKLLAEESLYTYPLVATATGPGEYHISSGSLLPDHPPLKAAPDPEPTQTPRLREVPHQAPPEENTTEQAPQAGGVPDPQVREWARRYSVPKLPARGRVPAAVREIFHAFHNGDQEPWRQLLLDHDVDPDKALAQARALTLVDSQPKPEPTEEELLRKKAKNVGRLNPQQVARLRRMFTDDNGRATTDGTSGDKASFQALESRDCCTKVSTRKNKVTYQITDVGRVWFQVYQVSPNAGAD